MIKLIIFDMDDTLIHLDVPWEKVEENIYSYAREHGGEAAESMEYTLLLGKNVELKKDLMKIFETGESEGWRNATLMPNAKEVLELFSHSYMLALVTGNGKIVARKALDKFGLERYFSAIATREDGIKPTPSSILTILNKLGCEPEEAVFVGNGMYDVLAAKAAGVGFIGYTSTSPAEEFKKAGADNVITDLMELKELLK